MMYAPKFQSKAFEGLKDALPISEALLASEYTLQKLGNVGKKIKQTAGLVCAKGKQFVDGIEIAEELASGIGSSKFTKCTSECKNKVAKVFNKTILIRKKQLQKKFKHASDFGIFGNYNSINAQRFNLAIQKHLNAFGTKKISGTYRGSPVTFHIDPSSGLTVIQNFDAGFLSGWKLNSQQLKHVLNDRKL